jgi:hypothetical protein
MKGPCTVGKYLAILGSKLTQYDMRESAREARRGHPNIYRLGHLLDAKQKAEADVAAVRDRYDPEALDRLRAALAERFTPNFSPVNAVLRQMTAGKCHLK